MPKEISPTVVWITIAVIVLVVVGIGYKMFGSGGFHPDTSGSEATMQKVKSGQPMYQPPSGIPALQNNGVRPGAGGSGSMGGAPGMPGGVPSGPPR